MTTPFDALLSRMQQLKDLSGAIMVLGWDQQTYLPVKAERARGEQLATLQTLVHGRLVDPELGALLETCAEDENLAPDARAMVRVTAWERDRAVRMPPTLVPELAQAQAEGLTAWRAARDARRFSAFRPALARLLELRRAQADALGYAGGERYDALLEAYEPGMRVARLTPVFEALELALVPLVDAVCARPSPQDWFRGDFPAHGQWRLSERVLGRMGFDLEAGRLDKSIHPFSLGPHPRDVRLTTRVDPTNLRIALYVVLHEGGHGLYQQGLGESLFRTPLAASPSMGLDESQSRLWENMVGRSLPFWEGMAALARSEFPQQLQGADAHSLFRAANRVERSPIRGFSDELTYNLHILLRYQLELLLVRDELPLEDLPEEWSRRSERLLGVQPKDDVEGVLQDIHWSTGDFGYFPTYTLGNLYAASIWAALRRELPGVDEAMKQGDLSPIGAWLRRRVYAEGFRYPAEELVQRVTGAGLTDADFIAYVTAKYGALYALS